VLETIKPMYFNFLIVNKLSKELDGIMNSNA